MARSHPASITASAPDKVSHATPSLSPERHKLLRLEPKPANQTNLGFLHRRASPTPSGSPLQAKPLHVTNRTNRVVKNQIHRQSAKTRRRRLKPTVYLNMDGTTAETEPAAHRREMRRRKLDKTAKKKQGKAKRERNTRNRTDGG